MFWILCQSKLKQIRFLWFFSEKKSVKENDITRNWHMACNERYFGKEKKGIQGNMGNRIVDILS